MGPGSFAYKFVFLLHLTAIIIGFGSSFVWPAAIGKARKLDDPKQLYTVSHIAEQLGARLTSGPIYLAIIFGFALVFMSNEVYTFKQLWVTLASIMALIAIGVAEGLHRPNLKKMDQLQEKLATGQFTPSPEGPPAEVLELQKRGPRAAMTGGILHLLWLLFMIDMIWKPGA